MDNIYSIVFGGDLNSSQNYTRKKQQPKHTHTRQDREKGRNGKNV